MNIIINLSVSNQKPDIKSRASQTFIDLKNLIQLKNPHALGVIETDIYGNNSTNVNRATKFSTEEIMLKLHIDGYRIELPDSWKDHGVARIVVYISDEIVAVKHVLPPTNKDLQSVTLDIGLGREKKTTVNFFYHTSTRTTAKTW